MAHDQQKDRPAAGQSGGPKVPFHLMAKPAGPVCNLRCRYCFYREKEAFFPGEKALFMPEEVLEAYTREYIRSQPGPSVLFEWQGGEPALAGLDFFRKALEFQKKYNQGKEISNSFQTNGTLLDESWCAFLSKNRFLVGLSLDGPEAVHDAFRVDRDGGPTFSRVLDSLRLMQKHGVEFNVLAAVNRESAKKPLEIYRFFREKDVRFIQFVPIVEREADGEAERLGLSLAVPPSLDGKGPSLSVTPWSVKPEAYGDFLIGVFDEWVRNDVGRVFVMNFEWALAAWAGVGPGMCHLAPRCGRNLILEHNGDVFSCDHFMYPAYRLGNIREDGLGDMVLSEQQAAFGASKETALPGYCRRCDVLFVCRGGCLKHRFGRTPGGDPGLNYLCGGFKKFYRHAGPVMKRMTELIGRGLPVAKIMEG